MRKFVITALLFLHIPAFAADAEPAPAPKIGDEVKKLTKVFNELTPEQRTEVYSAMEGIGQELADVPPEQREEFFEKARKTIPHIDFDKANVQKLDPNHKLSDEEIGQMLEAVSEVSGEVTSAPSANAGR